MTGTHDTETLAAWWDRASDDERRAFLAVPSPRELAVRRRARPVVRRLARRRFWTSPIDPARTTLFLPLQDLFGWRDRINMPGTVDDSNWTWRLPWPVDTLTHVPAAAERAAFCRRLAASSGRA